MKQQPPWINEYKHREKELNKKQKISSTPEYRLDAAAVGHKKGKSRHTEEIGTVQKRKQIMNIIHIIAKRYMNIGEMKWLRLEVKVCRR